MTMLIAYALLALAVSFLCSLLEACLLSVPRSYVESMVERGSRSGLALREMKDNVDRPLAAILTLNTVAHTVGAAGVGGQAAIVFGSHSVGIASAVMTVLILVLSEILPKTLGTVHARELAAPGAAIIRFITTACLPVILALEWINRRLSVRPQREALSRAELLATIRLGHASGAMRQREYRIASNLIALSSVRLSDVLTPRTVVFSLPEEMTVGQAKERHDPIRFARIPIYRGDPEQVTGYVARFALYAAADRGADKPLRELARPMPILPELAAVSSALDEFIQHGHHIALVVDEHGGMAGIVTLEDLLETLLGEEIVDETDPAVDMRALARQRRDQRRAAAVGRR